MKEKPLKTVVIGVLIGFVLAVPYIGFNEAIVYFLSMVMIMSIFAMGLDLVFGVSGMMSLGHAAFFGIGAYTLSILTINYEVSFGMAFLASGLFPSIIATLFGFLAVRLTALFFALTTMALAELIYILATFKLRNFTGGMDGLSGVPRPEFWSIDFYENSSFYIFIALIFFTAFCISAVIRSSPFGQVLKGMRQNEIRAEQIGFNIKRFKLGIFVISGFYSGIAGALMASLMFFVDSGNLTFQMSVEVVIMVLLGGLGTLVGPVLGVFVFQLLSIVLSSYTSYWNGIIGIVFIVYTIFFPTGMMGLAKSGWQLVAGMGKGGKT